MARLSPIAQNKLDKMLKSSALIFSEIIMAIIDARSTISLPELQFCI